MGSVSYVGNMGGEIFCVGDEVQDNRVRFFIGAINESSGLCFIDKSRQFTRLIADGEPFSRCIDQGNYATNYAALTHIKAHNA